MDAEFWLKKWKRAEHGWTQKNVNSRLVRYWPEIVGVEQSSAVLVPLCGDSIDLDWLVSTGNQVCGCDLSQDAFGFWSQRQGIGLEEVSAENTGSELKHWTVVGGWSPGLPLQAISETHGVDFDSLKKPHFMSGDFLALRASDLPFQPQAVYDRAALIALSPELRKKYAAQLTTLLTAGARVLLITMSYDQDKMKGPPFSVSDEEVHDLFNAAFDIERLAASSGPDILGSLSERGLDSMDESVFRLTRK